MNENVVSKTFYPRLFHITRHEKENIHEYNSRKLLPFTMTRVYYTGNIPLNLPKITRMSLEFCEYFNRNKNLSSSKKMNGSSHNSQPNRTELYRKCHFFNSNLSCFFFMLFFLIFSSFCKQKFPLKLISIRYYGRDFVEHALAFVSFGKIYSFVCRILIMIVVFKQLAEFHSA